MDNETDDLLPKKPRFIPKALPLSRIELIEDRVSTQAELPAHIFGPEPEHNWCYYFEKADLARQKGDWQDIAILGDMLFSSDGTSIELSSNEIMDMMEGYSQAGHWEKTAELTPFIHGYAHTGLWNKAQQLTLKAYKISPKLKNYLCSNWHTIQNATPSDQSQDETLNNVIQNLGCSFE